MDLVSLGSALSVSLIIYAAEIVANFHIKDIIRRLRNAYPSGN